MAVYKITNFQTNMCLNISGSNVTNLYNHQNVTVWTDTGSNEQKWEISSLGNGVLIKSIINQSFALNVYRSGSPYNCDVMPWSGNETDAKVNISKNTYLGGYAIKLTNYGLYLTASGSSNGNNVYWDEYRNNSHAQLWSFTQVSTTPTPTPTSNSLSMPQNLSQKYDKNDQIIKDAGCCICCACDVASYYAKKNYTLNEMREKGVYTLTSAVCQWGNVPSASFANYTGESQDNYRSKICSEINAGRPVLVYMQGTYSHWVVAYAYTSGGANNASITVLDPYNPNTSSSDGLRLTLAAAMSTQGASSISYLVTTKAK